jgi:hypothetical protein
MGNFLVQDFKELFLMKLISRMKNFKNVNLCGEEDVEHGSDGV